MRNVGNFIKKLHSDKQNFTGIGFPCVENLNSNLVAPVLQATIASSRRSLLLQMRCLEQSNYSVAGAENAEA
jgi:hypothetical protein